MLLPDEQIKTILFRAGTDQKTLDDLVTFTKDARVSLQDAAIEKDVVTDERLGLLISEHIKFPFISLSKINIPESVFRIVPERLARKYKVISFARGEDGIKLAMSDPTDVHFQEMIIKKTGQRVVPHLATERDIQNTLQVYRRDLKKSFDELLQSEIGKDAGNIGDVPIAKIVDLLIKYAYRDKASDIHIEPEERDLLIRFRIDG